MLIRHLKSNIFLCFLFPFSFTYASSYFDVGTEEQLEKLNIKTVELIYAGYLDLAEEKNDHLKSLSKNRDSFYYKCSIIHSALISNFRGDNESTIRYLNLINEAEELPAIQYYYYYVFSRYAFQAGQSQLGINYLIKTIEVGENIPHDTRIVIDTLFNKLYLIYYSQSVEERLTEGKALPDEVHKCLKLLETYKSSMLPYEVFKYYNYLIFFSGPNEYYKVYQVSRKLIELGKENNLPTACINGHLYSANYYNYIQDSIKEKEHLMQANSETKKIQYLYPVLWTRYEIMDYYDTRNDYKKAKYWAIKALFPPGTDYSNYFDIYGRLSSIYEKMGQIDSAYYYKKIDYTKYKEISRTHDNNMESLLIKNMEENIMHKELIIKRNYIFIGVIFTGLLLGGFLLYKNRRINNQLIQQNKELEESYSTLENFSHILSHDLKAPIRSINHLTTFMEEDESQLSAEGKENLSLIKESSNNASVLITNIMAYLHSKNTKVKKEYHPLKTLIQNAENNLMPSISSTQTLILFENLPKNIYGNDILLTQLFQNLIQNSIKYRKKEVPPIITISYKKEKSYGIVSFYDNGIGIKEERQQTIFKAFTQEKFISPEQGIGLGLSICKNIMDHHNGKISVVSKKGVGTSMVLHFPSHFFT